MKNKNKSLSKILTITLVASMVITGIAFITSSTKKKDTSKDDSPSYPTKLDEELAKFKEAKETVDGMICLEVNKEDDIVSSSILNRTMDLPD